MRIVWNDCSFVCLLLYLNEFDRFVYVSIGESRGQDGLYVIGGYVCRSGFFELVLYLLDLQFVRGRLVLG